MRPGGPTSFYRVAMKRLPLIPLLLIVGGLAPVSGRASIIETDLSSTVSAANFDADISAIDLINLGQSSLANWTSSVGNTGNVNTQISGIFNGTANNGGNGNNGLSDGSLTYLGSTQTFNSPPARLDSNPVLTFYFNLDNGTGGSSTGYSLTSIQSINGWRDFGSMSDQRFTISISTDSNQLIFSDIYTVDYHPFNPSSDNPNGQANSSKVVLTNLGLDGVTAIRFTFSAYNNGSVNQAGQLIREIDVFGTATPVPEPSALAYLVAGSLGMLVAFRSRKRVASGHC